METKPKKPMVRYESLLKAAVIPCEWNLCTYTASKMEVFLEHIVLHTSAISDTPNELGFSCIWRHCTCICDSRDELVTHVLFHAFHSKIKAIGKVVVDKNGCECFLDNQTRNILPELPDCFECMWDNCDIKFNSAQNFYWHTQAHAMAEERVAPIHCRWKDCTKTFAVYYRLQEHLRSHTQEKLYGCPNCGSILFAMNHFVMHHDRQKEADPSFQCSYCKRQYPTEAILKDHVRTHINQFKCPQCEMTLPRRTGIEVHRKYRHSNSKPYKCPECPKRFTCRVDVVVHMNVHSPDPSFFCPFPDCSYNCRSYDGYTTHITRVHQAGPVKSYQCHMCDHKATKGRYLTKHLRGVHNYQWPAGHTNFRYRKDEDGLYRLQTTRYESLELAEQITSTNRAENSPQSDAMSEPDLVIQV